MYIPLKSYITSLRTKTFNIPNYNIIQMETDVENPEDPVETDQVVEESVQKYV